MVSVSRFIVKGSFLSHAWSQDGHLLTALTKDSVRTWQATTYHEVGNLQLDYDDGVLPLGLALAHDSKTLAISDTSGQIVLADIERQEIIGRATLADDPIATIVWHPDGRHLVAGVHDRQVVIWDTQTNTAISRVEMDHRAVDRGAAVSPDGVLLAVPCFDGNVWIFDAKTGVLASKNPGSHDADDGQFR